MANEFLDAQVYANSMLLLLKNQLVTGRLVSGEFRNQVTDENGLKINVKRPQRFARNDASAMDASLSTQDIVNGSVDIKVNQYAKVHVGVGDIEWVQSYNQLISNQTMISAGQTLPHNIDNYLQQQIVFFPGHVGGLTPATDPDNFIASPQDFNRVHTQLMNQGVPNDGQINATVLFDDGERIRGDLIDGNINQVNRRALERIRIPILSEIDLYATQQVAAVKNGTRTAAATTLVDGNSQEVNYRDVKDDNYSSLVVKGQSSGKTFTVGEVFTIAGCYAWDWRNEVPLPYLQQFVIVGGTGSSGTVAPFSKPGTTITAGGSGAATLFVSPPIVVQGSSDGVSTDVNTAFGTVTAAPVDNAVITHLGPPDQVRRVRAAWHKKGVQLVTARLHRPFTGESSYATDPQTGISIRYWRGSDISTGRHYHRWDCIYGAANVDPYLGSRVSGAAA